MARIFKGQLNPGPPPADQGVGRRTRYDVYLAAPSFKDKLVESRVNRRAAQLRADALNARVRSGTGRLYYVCPVHSHR